MDMISFVQSLLMLIFYQNFCPYICTCRASSRRLNINKISINILFSVLCPNGTIFNQEVFVCDWWFNFDCSSAEGLYGLNDENAAEAAAAGSASAPQSGYGAGRR